MSIRAYVIAIALVIAVVGGIFIFDKVDATLVTGETIQCGTVAEPNGRDARVADLSDAMIGGTGRLGGAALCSDALATQKTWTLILLFGGIVVALGAFVTRRGKPASTPGADSAATA
jgi:preprotein translocase subunit SecG